MDLKNLLKFYATGIVGVLISQGLLYFFVNYGLGEHFGYPLFWGMVITTMLIALSLTGRMP
jgi:putative flippase GtrA